MAETDTEETPDRIKVIREAVKKAKKAKRGEKNLIAKEANVHPTTLSKWLRNPKYNSQAKVVTSKKRKGKVNKVTKVIKPSTAPKNETSYVPKFSLRDAVSQLPTSYEGLLREHIKLLIETHPERE